MDESCATADLSNIRRPNGPAYSTGELLDTPLVCTFALIIWQIFVYSLLTVHAFLCISACVYVNALFYRQVGCLYIAALRASIIVIYTA